MTEKYRTRQTSLLLLLALTLPWLSSGAALAYFESIQAGARGTAMGRAYGAIADDASAIHWNTAASVTIPRAEVLVTYAKPYAIPNLQSNFVSGVMPWGDYTLGASWHHTGVSGVMSEDLITIGAARDILPAGGDYAMAIGGNLKFAHIGFSDEYGGEVRVTGDLSTLVNLTPTVSASYVVQNVIEPEFDLVDGEGGTDLKRTHDVGLAYRWHPESTFALSATRDPRGEWVFHTGGEVWFLEVFGLRTGVFEGDFTGGVGLKTENYLVDLAFVTHDELGVSYEVSVRVPFGGSRW